jgi:CspA family cold shock protein
VFIPFSYRVDFFNELGFHSPLVKGPRANDFVTAVILTSDTRERMGKLILRKIIVALVFAAIVPFIVAGIFTSLVTGLQLTDGTALTADNLMNVAGMTELLLVVAVLTLVTSLLSAQLVPSRRRRFRSSGTVVESDVEDGRERGVVKWFNVKKGFGFITWDQGEDVFVHFRSIRGQGHRSLTEGQRVKFTVVRGQKGPQAEDVSAVR